VLLPVKDSEFELFTSRLSVSTAYWTLHNIYPNKLLRSLFKFFTFKEKSPEEKTIGLRLKIQKSIKKSYFPYEICPVIRQKRDALTMRSKQKSILDDLSRLHENVRCG
jgi:hypothetical protein